MQNIVVATHTVSKSLDAQFAASLTTMSRRDKDALLFNLTMRVNPAKVCAAIGTTSRRAA